MKKILYLFVLLFVAFGLFAGGGQSSAPSGPIDYGTRGSGANYWWVKFQEPVKIRSVMAERPATPYMQGDDVTSNEWTRAFKQELNVELTYDWVSSVAGYTEKLNLAIASNELPDVFYTNPDQFSQLVEAGITADITDYIANNSSDMIKAIMASAPVVTSTVMYNGRQMGFPRYGYGDVWMPRSLWIRHDWMARTGLGEPQNFEDIERIMDAFMRANPGSYGFGLNRNLEEFYRAATAFGAKPRIWIDGPDGQIMYGSIMPEMKLALERFADWYRRGYLRRDFMSMDLNAVISDIAAERVGLHIHANSAGWGYMPAIRALTSKYGMTAYMDPYEIPTAIPGKPHIHTLTIDNTQYIVYNKNARNIAAALKCMSYHAWVVMEATLQGGLTDAQVDRFLLGGEGRHDVPMLSVNDPYGNGPLMVEWAHKVGLNNYQITEPPMTAEWIAQYEQAAPWWRNNDVEGYGRWIQQYNPRSSAWNNLKIMNEGRFTATRLLGAMPEAGAAYGSTLDEILAEGFTKIIIGQEPVSYFDRLVAEWRSSGGDVVTRAVQRVYGGR